MLALVVTVLGLLAIDVTGTWTGTLTPEGRDATPALLVLTQDGSTITGTAGATAEAERHPIRNGLIKGDVITFDIEINEGSMKFDLKVTGEQLAGTVIREKDGQQQKAALLVTRAK
jgi:hypothetical protein